MRTLLGLVIVALGAVSMIALVGVLVAVPAAAQAMGMGGALAAALGCLSMSLGLWLIESSPRRHPLDTIPAA